MLSGRLQINSSGKKKGEDMSGIKESSVKSYA